MLLQIQWIVMCARKQRHIDRKTGMPPGVRSTSLNGNGLFCKFSLRVLFLWSSFTFFNIASLPVSSGLTSPDAFSAFAQSWKGSVFFSPREWKPRESITSFIMCHIHHWLQDKVMKGSTCPKQSFQLRSWSACSLE